MGNDSPKGAGPFRVGLTGGIASGKSVVLRRLARAGLATLDLDAVARHVMEPGGPAFAPVVNACPRATGPSTGGDSVSEFSPISEPARSSRT